MESRASHPAPRSKAAKPVGASAEQVTAAFNLSVPVVSFEFSKLGFNLLLTPSQGNQAGYVMPL